MIYYVIPAREGSKGFPHKNRRLWKDTYHSIPTSWYDSVILTTDDSALMNEGKRFNVHNRPEHLCTDTASIKDVLSCVADDYKMAGGDIIVMLYLTYPERTTQDIRDGIEVFKKVGAKSLLCKQDVKSHPFLCIDEFNNQVIKHDLFRRQDYPPYYEISHFLAIMYVDELPKLNKNLYSKNTYFMPIKEVIDVDYISDYEKHRGIK